MYYKKIIPIIILINFIYYCNGCIRNSAAQVGPTITTGSMFPTVTTSTAATTTTTIPTTTTTLCPNPCGAVPADATVTVTQVADASCMYTTTVTCVNPSQMLRFNNVENLTPPRPLTCNLAAPGMPSYQYLSITGLRIVMSLTCV